METLVLPYRRGDRELTDRYEDLLRRSAGLRLLELTTPLLRTAAELRAELGVKTPDAIQLAAAIFGGCSALVTNDRRLPEIPGLRVLQLSDYLG
jgi:predicted nucleic acid-binding protein